MTTTTARSRRRLRASLILVLSLCLATLVPAGARAAARADMRSSVGQAAAAAGAPVDLADPDATPATRSVFAYLRDIGGKGTLFGHQEDLLSGESFTQPDGTSSDVRAATGDYPAVIGFDTLERTGMSADQRQQKAAELATDIQHAHDVGAISTMTVHMENLVTGNDFYDTSGDALRAVLPGGSHHAALVAYLDRIAYTAQHAIAPDGTPIPIIFRPWHENAGSWFWWGAAFGTPGEYRELYRFTVEYLRDVKGVHNFLYAFSPGGGFGGDTARYLRTYPGDDFVDVLGVDSYDDSGASSSYLSGMTADLGMIADQAAQRGKICAFTEFGLNGGVRPDGQNKDVTWYTDVLNAIKADPSAARISYLLTWANYGGSTTPYTPVDGEMLPDFRAFHDDPFTVFATDLHGVYDTSTTAVPARPTAHLASPADGARVADGPETIRASVTGVDAERVYVSVDGSDQTIELSPPAPGQLWWTGTWDIPADELDNSSRGLTLHVISGGKEVMAVPSTVLLGPRPRPVPGVVDDFESYGDDAALRTEYVPYNANTISLSRASDGGPVGSGQKALRFSYSFAHQSYTGIGKQLGTDWSKFSAFRLWVDPDASHNKLVLQLVAGGVAYEAYPSLAGDTPYALTIPFADWRPAPWDTAHAGRRLTAADLADVTQFNIYVNAADDGSGAGSGSIVLDDLHAISWPPVYRDVAPDRPQYNAIQWLHSVDDLGDAQHRYHPDRATSRGEWAAVLRAYDPHARVGDPDHPQAAMLRLDAARSLWKLAGSPATRVTTRYDDVPADDAEAVAWVVRNAVIPADGATSFGAGEEVTRADLAAYVYSYDQLP
ncbi:MAG TPA: glycosyl hydrolase [Flexivirga sp.]|uniref:glycosyl hydrolase n=1 Tax=Flexivirga sp. TaxID=1962927 RepID=UPI002CE7B7D4|nr:glycosyl hydrolase [Flexivirga sp.]HWC23573.1 glycosyl hydrolase [Flexivirga sp.]